MKEVESNFLVLEHKPKISDSHQGNRVLECTGFTKNSFKIKGKARFKEFKMTLSMPQDGSRIETNVMVIKTGKNYFIVKSIKPTKELLKKINWWF